MRRGLPVAVVCVVLAASSGAIAQRGGAAHFGGHAGGFSGGGFHGGFAAPRSFAGFSGGGFSGGGFSRGGFSSFPRRGFTSTPRMAPRMMSTAPRYGAVPRYNSAFRPAYGADDRGRNHGGRYPFRPPYRGDSGYGAYGYPYYSNSWELLLWDLGYPDFTDYGDDSGTYQQPDQSEPQPPLAAPPDEGYRQDYAPPYEFAPAPSTPATPATLQPQLTLIFQDGHTQKIRNYMMTRSAVIVTDEAASGREPRIPLSDLNLPATARAAQQAGLDFSPPTS